MAAIDDLRAAVSDLQAAAQSEHDELSAVVSELGGVESQLTALQQQVAAGGGVSEADLAGVAQSVTGVAQAARTAVEQAKASPAVTAGQPAPSAPAPGPAPAAPAPGPAPAQQRSVYTFDGDPSTVDTTVWPSSGLQTTDSPPRPLFFYTGDTAPGDHNGDGVGGVWHLYTGATQPAGGAAEAETGGPEA